MTTEPTDAPFRSPVGRPLPTLKAQARAISAKRARRGAKQLSGKWNVCWVGELRSGHPEQYREARMVLLDAGWTVIRQRGSHEVWAHPDRPGGIVVCGLGQRDRSGPNAG